MGDRALGAASPSVSPLQSQVQPAPQAHSTHLYMPDPLCSQMFPELAMDLNQPWRTAGGSTTGGAGDCREQGGHQSYGYAGDPLHRPNFSFKRRAKQEELLLQQLYYAEALQAKKETDILFQREAPLTEYEHARSQAIMWNNQVLAWFRIGLLKGSNPPVLLLLLLKF